MALDEADHRLFIGTHQPARLAVFDTFGKQGKGRPLLPGHSRARQQTVRYEDLYGYRTEEGVKGLTLRVDTLKMAVL